MYINQTWQEILNWTRAFADIAIVWFIIYYAIKIVRNNSRTIQIFKGIILVLVLKSLANFLGLSTIGWLADMFVSYGFLAIIVIFVPEIRSILERLGKSNVLSRISTLSGNEKEHLVNELVKSAMVLSKSQTGALITIEQGQSLLDYIKTGTQLNSLVSTELLTSIFVTTTPLHDGAVIILGDRIACASAYFPPTNLELPNRYGARHRAAIGISEITDSITIVISEETGVISIAEEGKIRAVDSEELRDYLLRSLCNEETELTKGRTRIVERKAVYVVDEPVEIKRKGKIKVEEGQLDSEKVEKARLFNKLAIKKQDKKEEDQKSLFKPKKQKNVMDQLEEESNIKLPHKNTNLVEATEPIEVVTPTDFKEIHVQPENQLEKVTFEFSGQIEDNMIIKTADSKQTLIEDEEVDVNEKQ